jgi:hypothetical protein
MIEFSATALNSTLLHELYFASLGGDGRVPPEEMANAIARDFGSVTRWRQEFIALAEALAGGSGWVLLTYVARDARLINQSATDHNQGISGGIPILALNHPGRVAGRSRRGPAAEQRTGVAGYHRHIATLRPRTSYVPRL